MYDWFIILVMFTLFLYVFNKICNKFIKLGYDFLDLMKSKSLNHKVNLVEPFDKPFDKSHDDIVLDKSKFKSDPKDLPIEVLAPALANPPRSPGGFGTRVVDNG